MAKRRRERDEGRGWPIPTTYLWRFPHFERFQLDCDRLWVLSDRQAWHSLSRTVLLNWVLDQALRNRYHV